MSSAKSKVSCVIRTFNEARFVDRCIDELHSQERDFELEIVVVDSGSTDNTLSILQNYDVKLVRTERQKLKNFDYSHSLNLGIEASEGWLIVVLSAHSILVQKNWLQKMVSHFDDDNVSGVYCRQIPWPDTDWAEKIRIGKSFQEHSQEFNQNNLYALNTFSNAASCIRRDVWEAFPFVLPAAEDIDWARRVAWHGYKIIYDAEVSVYHSHKETTRQKANRRINLEKASDIRLSRDRNFLFTTKQAAGGFLRSLREISALKTSIPKKIVYVLEDIAKEFWFVLDFSNGSNNKDVFGNYLAGRIQTDK